MHKLSTINVRIEPNVKKKAEKIFHTIGLSTAEAIRLFYKQVCLQQRIPFELKIPNEKTIQAMKDADDRKTLKAKNVDDLLED